MILLHYQLPEKCFKDSTMVFHLIYFASLLPAQLDILLFKKCNTKLYYSKMCCKKYYTLCEERQYTLV